MPATSIPHLPDAVLTKFTAAPVERRPSEIVAPGWAPACVTQSAKAQAVPAAGIAVFNRAILQLRNPRPTSMASILLTLPLICQSIGAPEKGKTQVPSNRTSISWGISWGIALLIGVAIAISYLDRQTLPWAIKAVQADIPISNQVKAALDSAFLLAYGLMYLGGGWLLDRIGTRRGFLLSCRSGRSLAPAMDWRAMPGRWR